MKQSALSMLLNKNHVELGALQGKSKAWFDAQVKTLVSVKAMRSETLMRGDQESKGNKIIPGNMYMYIYDPKTKEQLPYYDMFPLVFPFHALKDGFIGLNLHYLPYRMRAQLMDRLMQFKTDSRYDERTKLKLQWQTLSTSSKFAMVQPCVKRYLYSHVKTPFKAVHSQDWATALLLPTEKFAKKSAQQVWADSIKIIQQY